jgi:hypothetical protein
MVEAEPLGSTSLSLQLLESATTAALSLLRRAMPRGELNQALVPAPSLKLTTAEPARVLTVLAPSHSTLTLLKPSVKASLSPLELQAKL